MKRVTLCYLLRTDEKTGSIEQVCLALKKKGFGVGRWNGVGGKVQEGESIEDATKREAQEEIGVHILSMQKMAEITFLFPHHPDWDEVAHIYLSSHWKGEPYETEEMGTPTWFDTDKLPYDGMWAADKDWLPLILQGKYLKGTVVFGTNDIVLEKDIRVINAFPHDL